MKKLAFVEELSILNRQTAKSNNESCLFLYFPFLCGLFLERCRSGCPEGIATSKEYISLLRKSCGVRRGVRVAEGARLESVYT